MDLGLEGRTCVVTGAGEGIGRDVARQLCAEGASVLLVARGDELGATLSGIASRPVAGRSPSR